MSKEYVVTKSDMMILFCTGLIAVINGKVVILKPDYPNQGGFFSDMKQMVNDGAVLKADSNGIYIEESEI
jgi:hypothetical protein